MLISHSNRFVFLKTKKTAGTSLQAYLARRGGALCDAVTSKAHIMLPAGSGLGFESLGPHAGAAEVFKVFGRSLAQSAVIVSERNPYDKLVSAYFYRHYKFDWPVEGDGLAADFETRLRAGRFDALMSDDVYRIGDVNIADYLLRYEHLEDDLAETLAALGLPATASLNERRKSHFRPDDYRRAAGVAQLFTPDLVDFVRGRFPHYFDRLGYGGIGSDCPPFQPEPARIALRQRLTAHEPIIPRPALPG